MNMTDFLRINYMYIPAERWDNFYEKSSQMVRYRPYNLFSIFLLHLFLPNFYLLPIQFCKDLGSMPYVQ